MRAVAISTVSALGQDASQRLTSGVIIPDSGAASAGERQRRRKRGVSIGSSIIPEE